MEARSYQLELLEYLTQENGIIYLPTGAGKTYVAILAIKRFSKDMNKSIQNGGKRGVFMCNTVELARQQALEMRKHTNLKVGLYTGEREVDNWNAVKWLEEIAENQVLVGTAQVFLDIIAANFIKVTDLSIVVIDECHHGTKKHPMHEFMHMFKFADRAKLPRVIGLTGVLIKGNKLKHIMESLHNLEVTYRGGVVTVSNKEEFLNVLIYSTSPQEQLLLYSGGCYSLTIDYVIKNLVGSCMQLVDNFDVGVLPIKLSNSLAEKQDPTKKKFIKNLLKDFLYHLGEYGLYCALFVLETAIIDLEMKLRQAEVTSFRRLYSAVINQLHSLLHLMVTKLSDCINETKSGELKDEDFHKIEVIMKLSTPKVVCLLRYIKSVFELKQHKNSSCLVFVERRLTAKAICSVVQKFVNVTPALKGAVRPDLMVGRNASVAAKLENVLERQWANKVMADFRSGACNMIICSNVLEEGIDVQACNLVITFDLLKTFNAYIQTKGRARTKDSTFVMMAPKTHESQVVKQVFEYKTAYKEIQEFLIGRIIDADDLSELELAKEFADRMPPLTTPSGACLLPSGALRLLHRYTQLLPRDVCGCVPPIFMKLPPNQNKAGVVVSVRLPKNSRVKEEIRSDPMESVRMAKASAAFKACKRLYEEGELNEQLLPVSTADCLKDFEHILFPHWEKYKHEVGDAVEGKSKRRIYQRKCPEELFNAMPVVGEICYAYEIRFTPAFQANECNAHVVQALRSASNYAILLRKQLPALAAMPLFMEHGSVSAKVSEQPVEFVLHTPAELLQLKKYQLMIWRDILQCWRSYLVLDARDRQQSFLVVPLTNGVIDWNVVRQFERLPPLHATTPSERENRNYKSEEWLGKIVGKWYTQNKSERFLVTKVLADQTPLSQFPDSKSTHKTYKAYFEAQHGSRIKQIVKAQQFLIEVKPLTTRLNFLINSKSKNTKPELNSQALVPELCHNFEHPGDLWLKACLLPSTLHRLHYLLHAENLRLRINKFLGLEKMCEAYKPNPLQIDQSLRRATADAGAGAFDLKELKEEHDLELKNFCEQFMEPINQERKSSSMYPMELQRFSSVFEGFETKLKLLQNIDENDYTDSHLEMPQGFDIRPKPGNEAKRRIAILELTLEDDDGVMCAEQHEFLTALTTSDSNDVFDMERLELLGDSYLKFSISLYLVNKYPKWHEGMLSEIKGKLVSNQNLLYCLLESDVPTRICSEFFGLQNWLPPLASLPVNILDALEQQPQLFKLISTRDFFNIKLSESEVLSGSCDQHNLTQFLNFCKDRTQLLSHGLKTEPDNELNTLIYKDVRTDKNIADTLEALLGVCVKNYGIHRAFRMLEFFGLCRPEPGDKPLTHLLHLELSSTHLRTNISQHEVDEFLVNHEVLERNLGYEFRDRAYLLQALTHPTYPTNRLTGCYQALEFIGDAVLDFLVSCYIFERYETKTPGMLTDLRSALVSNDTLACICVRHRFHLFLLAENAPLAESIKTYADFQATQKHRVTDQVRILQNGSSLNAGEASNLNIASHVKSVAVPKVLGDIVEALIAAVYLDSRSLLTTWHVIYGLLENELFEFKHKVPIEPVRQLFEHPTAKPIFSDPLIENSTTLVQCSFNYLNKLTVVTGFGSNRHQAKKSAAKHALSLLAKSF